ncbi:hypothetical protein C8R48DRAFT_768145 [Suillus tomentosus]|nr:hypothetical protein C8R48DRAFT_768145 [Suillus tomentosus]
MAPRTKFSAEEIDFMKTFHDQFLNCKAKRNYEPMWNPFFEAWAAKFPERAVVFKDIPLDVDLTEEQSAVVSKAWALRQQRLIEKFRNDLGGSKAGHRANGKHAATVNQMMKNIIKKDSTEKPTRVLKPWEMYSKTHYMKVKDAVKTEQEELKHAPFAKPANKTSLCIVRRHLKDAFDNESEEVRAEVLAAIEAMKEMKREDIEEAQKQNHDKDVYISKIGAILSQFFEELQEMTGWVFTVLMGGPHPASGGTLDISSFHIGTTQLGNRFSQAYPQFSQNIMVPYTQFVERVFPDAAALSRTKSLPAPDTVTSSTRAVTPGPSSTTQLASDTSLLTPLDAITAPSDMLLAPELLSFTDSGIDTFSFFSQPYVSPLPMDMDDADDTSQPPLPVLPMPPQPPYDETMHSLTQFLQDSSPQDPQSFSLPIIASPPRMYQQNPWILTGDESATMPNNAGGQPQPYHTADPAFIFPISSPPPSQAHSSTTNIPSGTTVPAAPASTPSTQTPMSLSDAAPRGPPSDTGEKRACESEGERSDVPMKRQKVNIRNTGPSHPTVVDETQNGRGKRQRFQSKRAAEANNIGSSSTIRKTGRN